MCGICGVFVSGGGTGAGQAAGVRAMAAALARRGPDDEGFFADGPCALGFRRLSILDLSPAGHQPMETPEGRHALVFNGELYNFRDLRRELEGRGVRFRSTGDAEVALHALAAWGEGALARFNGMFALAFWDAEARTLLLARDHAGIKPLLWMRSPGGGVVFASQMDALLAHPWGAGAEVSREGLGLYLRFGYVPAPWTLVDGVRAVDAGGWVRLHADGRAEEGRWWSFPQRGSGELQGEAAVDALDEALSRAVARQMVSDVPVGVFLSGGIDSPLVAAEAARHAGGGLRAFTIGVADDASMDESADARRYAEEMGLALVRRAVTGADALSALGDVVAACGEPTADFSIFPTLLVSALAREHVTVALSGDGGDELFWGYPGRFGSAIEQARYFGRPRWRRYGDVAARKLLRRGRATREVLGWPSLGRLYQKKHTLLAEPDLEALFPGLPPLPEAFNLFRFDGDDPDEAAHWVRWNEFRAHLARVLLKVDRASMYHSLEVRVPLLDREVIEVALRTDWRSCLALDARRGKIPLREALARRVRHQTAGKRGFTVPMHAWLAGPLAPLLRERVLERRDWFGVEASRSRLAALARRVGAGDRAPAWGLWLLLALALWDGRHGGGRAALRAA
ncbi:MAG TPA: asparagine synthase (glutamine-hydrolyzing) [Longimicrobium sp.]|nr:asparagine synthase (glutamine-hydrolyzing) [Longimicrobium sp.]